MERVVMTVAAGGDAFHGFVSGSGLAPLEGLTVRVSAAGASSGKTFTGTTGSDGYFSIDLAAAHPASRDAASKAAPTNVAQRIVDLFAAPIGNSSTEPRSGPEATRGQVEILKGDAVIYRDPMAVVLDDGSVYREYMIPDSAPTSGPGGQGVPSGPKTAPPPTSSRGAKSARPKEK
jgi:hypothetical protein